MTESATSQQVRDQAEQALATLRPAFKADGADLVISDVQGARVVVDLVFTPETCLECIVPNDILVAIVAGAIKDAVPGVDDVQVNDPR
jgi:Fe-S cluster biogenesis protein NfuA